MPIEPMEFRRYDKVSDDVYTIGPNVILRFNVSLSKITNNKRYHFYKEFEYPNRAKEDTELNTLVTIKRSYDFYLSIENIQKDKVTDDKLFIRIGPSDYYRLKSQLDTVLDWFTGKKYKYLFARSRGAVTLVEPVPDSMVGGYPLDKFIGFVPCVIDKGYGSDKTQPGVRMILSNYDNFVEMSFDRFMGFYYIISNFNMYIAAQNLVGYLGFYPGTNRFNMESITGRTIALEDFNHSYTSGVNDRVISNKKNISSLE